MALTFQQRKTKLLNHCPQREGRCVKFVILSPKKPNSGNKKAVQLSFGPRFQRFFCYIPGEQHTLKEHAIVLWRGGRIRDLPGMKYRVIRGVRDATPVARKTKRSKYGAKKPKQFKKK